MPFNSQHRPSVAHGGHWLMAWGFIVALPRITEKVQVSTNITPLFSKVGTRIASHPQPRNMIARNNISEGNAAGLNEPVANGVARTFHVWVVDDSAEFRELLIELLHGQDGIQCVREFESAEAALEALAVDTAPDAILLDNNMGGITGLEAIRRFRVLADSTRILMLTTFSDPETRSRAFQDGASDFLLKSYAPGVIAERVRQASARPPAPIRDAPPGPAPGPREISAARATSGRNWLGRLSCRMVAFGAKLSAVGNRREHAADEIEICRE